MLYKVYCDGAVEPRNPGGWGVGGWIIKDQDDFIFAKGTCDLGKNPNMTNNISEYGAVKAALDYLVEQTWLCPQDTVILHSDSQLIINQINDDYGCHSPTLRVLRDEIWILLDKLPVDIEFKWIRREENTEADAMSRSLYSYLGA